MIITKMLYDKDPELRKLIFLNSKTEEFLGEMHWVENEAEAKQILRSLIKWVDSEIGSRICAIITNEKEVVNWGRND